MARIWILVGMMGAGKSSVGRSLAELANREFLDTDLLLQHRLGRPISQVFQIYGEATFRDHETSVLRALEPTHSVLATGGGIVLRPENWAEFRRLGVTIYLRASHSVLVERLERSPKKRPLLQVEDWPSKLQGLIEERSTLYEQADLHVDVDELDLMSGAEKIYRALEEAGHL